ncbi:MAG: AMP-binding protein [Gemmatimonadota bacterium]|nr:MAG: AMP-binding protein [Gemmatimonadota bacterium]
MADTVTQVLEQTAARHEHRASMRVKRGGTWRTTTWSEYREQVMCAARGFIKLGLEPGQGVVIMGYNQPEWFVSDLAAIAAQGLPAGIYTTSTAEQCHYIADHAEATVAVVENQDYLEKFLRIRDRLPLLEGIVLMNGSSDVAGVYGWDQLLELGRQVSEERLRQRIEGQRPEDVCTLIYTSGTTGPPKSVMLSHGNMVWTARRIVESFDVGPQDILISYLPPSHIAEQMVSLHCSLVAGYCTWFAESFDRLGENLREVRPTILLAVPRVWEKIQDAMQAAGAESSTLKKRIVAWARRVGLESGYAEQRRRAKPLLYPVARKLVFSKVRQRLGLDRARLCFSSAAPISLESLEFFLSLGIPILEIYGLSECTGPATMSLPHRHKTGSVGVPVAGTEVEVASDGEILIRGRHVFLGYYKDEAETAEALDEAGWLHSGDIGEFDEQGFLRITDRKKELLVTSGGKNVAPQPLETKLRQIPAVSQAVVVGDRRKYLGALLTLDSNRIEAEAQAAGSPARDSKSAAACPIFRRHLEKQVAQVNESQARYETIKRFVILPEDFSIAGGELTPTMKIKRRVICEKYAEEVDELYKSEGLDAGPS